MKNERGVTLLEVLVAVTLLSLLSVGILLAMRGGFDSLARTNRRLQENRRVTGTRRILEQQLLGFIPVIARCGEPPVPAPFFQGDPQAMRLVTSYSLEESARGRPRIVELLVIPRENQEGVRLVVNEHLYTGPRTAGQFCLGRAVDPETSQEYTRFPPVQAGPGSFVLADRLASCRFLYQQLLPAPAPEPPLGIWRERWAQPRWPNAIRVEMVPLDRERVRLQPLTITAPVHVNRIPIFEYADL